MNVLDALSPYFPTLNEAAVLSGDNNDDYDASASVDNIDDDYDDNNPYFESEVFILILIL